MRHALLYDPQIVALLQRTAPRALVSAGFSRLTSDDFTAWSAREAGLGIIISRWMLAPGFEQLQVSTWRLRRIRTT